MSPAGSNTDWHALSSREVLERLDTGEAGLKEEEIPERLARFGPNLLPQPKPASPLLVFLRQFNSPLMYVVLGALTLSVLLGNIFDSLFIVAVILVNTTVGFVQEYRGERAIEKLKRLEKISVRVIRGGTQHLVASEFLVPGDIMVLSSGDKVPADARLLEASGFKVNEASLTGEWLAVEKDASRPLPPQTVLAERKNMVFLGTSVEEGWAHAVVVATGGRSELGAIVRLLETGRHALTPLQRRLRHLARLLGAGILGLIVVVLTFGFFRNVPLQELFVASIALTVSAIPEGLLPLITVILVVGTRRILRERALVRHLASIETLGSVTVIATDKTGTLTEGTMEASHILAGRDELLERSTAPKAKDGSALPVLHLEALTIGAVTGEAFVENPEAELERRILQGRPVDVAMLRAALGAGLEPTAILDEKPRVDFLPFEARFRLAASLHAERGGKFSLFVMGSPDTLLDLSSEIRTEENESQAMSQEDRERILELVGDLASSGLRIIGVARRELYRRPPPPLISAVSQLTFVGLVALRDPLRKDVKEALYMTRSAGIRTIVITGDHRKTAESLLEELGTKVEQSAVLEGEEIDAMNDKELALRLQRAVLCSRVSPTAKVRIVEALHANGEIVAMIGDGVNDAPALRIADAGVAVASGTDVAREVSDMVLLDGSFRTLTKAIEQGRVTFENIRKLLTYLIADDFSEVFLFLGAALAGLPVPLLPAHILWINIIEDSLPGIALAFEDEREGILSSPPRSPREGVVHPPLRRWFAAIFVITGISALVTFIGVYHFTQDLAFTRTLVFALMAVDSLFFAYTVRSFRRTIFRRDIFSNRLLNFAFLAGLGLLLLALYFPPLAAVLHTVPLGAAAWGVILAVSTAELLLLALTKKMLFS